MVIVLSLDGGTNVTDEDMFIRSEFSEGLCNQIVLIHCAFHKIIIIDERLILFLHCNISTVYY